MLGVRKYFCDVYHQVAVLHRLAFPMRCCVSRFELLVGMFIGIFVSFC